MWLPVILALAALNRLRGARPAWMKGKALIYVAPAVGMVSWLILPWHGAVFIAVWYAMWGAPAHGSVQMMGRPDPVPRRTDTLEAWCQRVAPGPFTAMLLFCTILAPPIGWLQAIAYELSWRVSPPSAAIRNAEVAFGATGWPLAIYCVHGGISV